MRLKALLPLLLTLIASCGDEADPIGPAPAPQFGRVVATMNGLTFISSYFPDSNVAVYRLHDSSFQVIGQRVQAGPWSTLQIALADVHGTGAFALAGDPRFVMAAWTPSPAAKYLSSSARGDSVWIDDFDLPTRKVTGRFRFTATDIHRPRSVLVQGAFQGHIFLDSTAFSPRGSRLSRGSDPR